MEDDADCTDDPEEKRRRIEAEVEAKNFGAAIGITISVVSAIAEHLTEQQQTSEQPEEPEVPKQDESKNIRWEQTM